MGVSPPTSPTGHTSTHKMSLSPNVTRHQMPLLGMRLTIQCTGSTYLRPKGRGWKWNIKGNMLALSGWRRKRRECQGIRGRVWKDKARAVATTFPNSTSLPRPSPRSQRGHSKGQPLRPSPFTSSLPSLCAGIKVCQALANLRPLQDEMAPWKVKGGRDQPPAVTSDPRIYLKVTRNPRADPREEGRVEGGWGFSTSIHNCQAGD